MDKGIVFLCQLWITERHMATSADSALEATLSSHEPLWGLGWEGVGMFGICTNQLSHLKLLWFCILVCVFMLVFYGRAGLLYISQS